MRAAVRNNQAQRRANVATLTAHIGRPDFYEQMARIDPRSASEWRRMVGMQAQFQRGESGYDRDTRTYSESMRESLHRVAIDLYRRQPPGDVFRHFIGIHGALFRENGAYSAFGRLAVLGHTNYTEVGRNLLDLGGGILGTNNYGPIARQAAEETRIARERRGLPITPR